MKGIVIYVALVLLFVVILLGVVWIVQGNDFFMYKVFAPAYQGVQREVFEQTKSYRQGMIQELTNMQFQYVQADQNQKDALASIILRRAADFDLTKDDVPYELRRFIEQLRSDRVNR